MSIVLRPMKETDLEFAIELANQEHWDYDLGDVRRLQLLFPAGCLIAEHNGVRAGWVVACTYVSLAWISSLVVSRCLRGKGIGAALVKQAVRFAEESGIRTVGLYSYSHSIRFYERMGFKQDCEFEHLEGTSGESDTRTVAQPAMDLSEVTELDRKYFHANREPLLRLLHREYPSLLFRSGKERMLGYIAGKSFSDNSAEIGPWVCEPEQTMVAEQLFVSELSALKSKEIGLTIPGDNSDAHHIVEKYGFRVRQKVLRMFSGDAEDLPCVKGVYAVAGLDVG